MSISAMFEPKEFTYNGYGAQRYTKDIVKGRPKASTHYWILRGPRGAVTFQVNSFEMPPKYAFHELLGLYDHTTGRQYMATMLMWHDPHELPDENYDGHQESCCFLDGHPCWNGGTGIGAVELLQILGEAMNENMVWEALVAYYVNILGEDS